MQAFLLLDAIKKIFVGFLWDFFIFMLTKVGFFEMLIIDF